MPETEQVPYSWIKQAAPELLEMDDIPLFGKAPQFPWDAFSDYLAKTFEIDSIKVEPGEFKWRAEEELKSDLGDHLVPQHFSIASFEGELCFLLSEQDLTFIMASLLTKEKAGELEEIDEDFEKGFYRFLGIECINGLSQIEFDKTLTPHLLNKTEMPEGPALSLDVSITLFDHTFIGRLILSPKFRQSWKEHYANRKLTTRASRNLLENLTVNIALEIGIVHLEKEDYRALAPGDLILPDIYMLNEEGTSGNVLMKIDGKPAYLAKLADGALEITETSPQEEVRATMSEKKQPEEKQEKDLVEDFEIDLEEEEEQEEDDEEEEDDEDFDIGDFDLDEEDEDEDEFDLDLEKEEKEKKPEKGEEEKKEKSTEEDKEKEEKPKEEKISAGPVIKAEDLVSPDSATISVSIEIGRLQIPMNKLLDLKQGNMLDLDVKPEDGVDLIVNGHCIGKGEILKVGNTLGIRILDMGS